MTTPILAVTRTSTTSTLPARATSGSIGYDVFADLPAHPLGMRIDPGRRKLVPLGFAMACPHGTYGRLAPRSGLSVKAGIHVMAGVIDPDYRGEVKVLLLNTSAEPVYVEHGTRVAQLILEQAIVADVVAVDSLDDTNRGNGGFGSTGMT